MPPIERTTGSRPVPTTTSSADAPTYTVKSGDTLGAIAARAGTTVDVLINLNQARYPAITNPKSLQAGWNLQLPSGAQAPTNPGAGAQAPGWAPRSNDKVLFVAVNN